MKKLTNILMSICVLTTVCGLTGCGGEKWEYAEDEGVSVGNSNCSDIVSDKAKENIREKLEDKYKDFKPKVNEESIKGLLKEEITLKKGSDYYFAESVRAEELDSIFEVNGHTAETYVDVSVYPDEEFMEYEMYAEYGGDTYCFAEVDFISPEYFAKKEAKEKEEQKLIESKMGEYKYKDIVDEENTWTEEFIKEIENVFKDDKLTVTEDCVQLLDYEFPIELNPYVDSLSEEIFMEEVDDIFSWNIEDYVQCIVKNDGTVCVLIYYKYRSLSSYSLITLTFIK